MTNKDDKLIQHFFQSHIKEIPDAGFCERVSERLPANADLEALSRRWTYLCVAAGLVLIVCLSLFHQQLLPSWQGINTETLLLYILRLIPTPLEITHFIETHTLQVIMLWTAFSAGIICWGWKELKAA